MFTRSDLSALMSAAPPLGVSIFLPTHLRGSEIRQDPIRLKNLAAEAVDKLVRTGMGKAEGEAFVEPATALVDDYAFWQHQNQGLAVFLDGDAARWFKVPLDLDEHVTVGPDYHVKPLLPILSADGAFLVLTITADEVALFDASRFAMAKVEPTNLPANVDDVPGQPDYENMSHASPAARPQTGSIGATTAQAYGDSPTEWNKARLVDFVRRVAAALDQHVADTPVPVVVVADAQIGGHFRKLTTLGAHLVGVVDRTLLRSTSPSSTLRPTPSCSPTSTSPGTMPSNGSGPSTEAAMREQSRTWKPSPGPRRRAALTRSSSLRTKRCRVAPTKRPTPARPTPPGWRVARTTSRRPPSAPSVTAVTFTSWLARTCPRARSRRRSCGTEQVVIEVRDDLDPDVLARWLLHAAHAPPDLDDDAAAQRLADSLAPR